MSINQTYLLYYFIVIFTTIMVLLSEYFRKHNKNDLYKFVFWSSILFPVIISGYRFGIGTDYFSYERIYYVVTEFNSIGLAIQNTSYEPGWIVLNYINKFIFNDSRYIFVITSFLLILFTFKALYNQKNKINVGIAVLIFMCTMYFYSFNGVRQYLAASILMLSLKYIESKEFKKFILVIIFAFSIHYTALIFLPTYWIINSNNKNIGLLKKSLFITGSILLLVFYQPLVSFITSFDLFSRYSHYQLEFQRIGLGNIIVKSPIIAIILFNYKKLKSKHNFIYHLVILYFGGLILEFFGYFAEHIGRIALYFEMIQIFVLSSIVKVQSNKYEKLLYICLIVIYFLGWFTYRIIIMNYNQTIPYLFK